MGRRVRLDLFLKLTGVFPARSQAKRALETGRVESGGLPLKPSHEVRVGESLRVRTSGGDLEAEVLEVPAGKNVPRSDRSRYLRILGRSGTHGDVHL